MAWNCLLESRPVPTHSAINRNGYALVDKDADSYKSSKISITFDMNKLQAIPNPGEYGSPGRVLVTMNPIRAPRSPQSSHVYYHPLITSESIIMSRHLHKINGVLNVSFAGAWMGYGFHEDGFAAGAHVAQTLIHGHDETAPLQLIDAPVISSSTPNMTDTAARMMIAAIQRLLHGEKFISTFQP